ncbi:MAG: PLP-dependent transferase [Terracidiphilus sp.]|jgi:cystathionine beta-lyase/cystathionine gamma-synthase
MPETNDSAQEKLHFTTRVLTEGFDPRLSVGSARPAVFRSSTYVFSTPEAAERAFDLMAGRAQRAENEQVDLVYSRFNHPNAEILEEQLVPLERGAQAALVFNTGMAAIVTTLFCLLKPGQTVVYTTPIYGGTLQLLRDFLPRWGVRGIAAPAGKGDLLDEVIRSAENLGIVLIETPVNPTLVMSDIRRACATVQDLKPSEDGSRPLVVIDNTMLGPAFQHPLPLGADLVVYSGTKYLAGHSDLLAGVILGKDPAVVGKIRRSRSLFGNILQPDECWMLNGRLPTVGLRMNRQSKNAQRIAEALHGHAKIDRVIYPTLFDDPEQVAIYKAECDFPGGMFSIVLKGGKPAAFNFLRHITIGRNAVSLGGVETLACHPNSTTHSGFTQEEFAATGMSDGLVRISVGIEDWRDLLADFEQALERC